MPDLVSSIMKEFGPWQLRAVPLIYMCKIPAAWFMAILIYTTPDPKNGEIYCKPPPSVSAHFNETKWIMASHPIKDVVNSTEFTIDYCYVFEDNLEFYNDPNRTSWIQPSNITRTKGCTVFEHHADYNSIITQFDLVCSRSLLTPTTQAAHVFGVLLGGIIAAQLMRTISPRNLMLLGMYTQVMCGCITGYIIIYEMHILLRLLVAMCCAFTYTAGSVILNDITEGKYKTATICLHEQFWSIGVIIMPGLAIFTNSWTSLYAAISIPPFLLIIIHRWIPDSPRWLLKQGRTQEAKVYLLEAAKYNNTRNCIPIYFDEQLKSISEAAAVQPEPDLWWTIWKERSAFNNLVRLHLAWGLFCTAYYGMLLNVSSYGRDKLNIHMVVVGVSELIGTFIGLYLIMTSKQKWLWCGVFNIVAGLIAFNTWIIPPEVPFINRDALVMLTAMISKASVSCCLAMLVTCTGELVSANKKAGAVYSCTNWGRFCFMVTPYIVSTVKFGQFVPLTAFASLAIIGGMILTGIVNETV
ncbi:organic cation transporter protein-like [Armigeres subalbatus]|uniref:organic cation transporter protein-like n=1 Tax=Armigeres subalbatus TaxID=124917 RepID=UPI002ED670C0